MIVVDTNNGKVGEGEHNVGIRVGPRVGAHLTCALAVLVSTIRECPSTAVRLSSPALRGCLTSVHPVPSVHNTGLHNPHFPPSLDSRIINRSTTTGLQ